MAAADRSTTTYVGLLVPWSLTVDDLIAADSTYTENDPQPSDDIVPAGTYHLSLEASGAQEDITYHLTTRRGGHVRPGGAGYTWRKSTDAASLERGFDPPNVPHYHARLRWAAAVTGVSTEPHAVRLPDGRVLVAAYETYLLGPTYRVTLYLLDHDGTPSSLTAYSSDTAPTAAIGSSWHPAVAVLDDGTVRLGHLLEDTNAEEAQWRVYDVTVDGGLAVSQVAAFALDVAINVDTSASGDGHQIRRVRWAHSAGDDLLLVWMTPYDTSLTHRHGYIQYASTSGGLRFERVELASNDADADADPGTFAYPDVIGYRGGFVLHYSDGPALTTQAFLSDAGNPISQQSGDNTRVFSGITNGGLDGTSKYFDEGDRALWVSPDGQLYASIRNFNSTRGAVLIARSTNGGLTWELFGAGLGSSDNAWHASGAAGIYPSGFCAVAGLGRSYVFGNHAVPTSTTYQGSLSLWALGGSTTLTMPANTEFGYDTRRAGWSFFGAPDELPFGQGWTVVSAGTFSEAITSGALVASTTVGQLYYQKTITLASIAQGWSGHFALNQASGGSVSAMRSGIEVQLSTASNTYQIQVRTQASPDRIELHDSIGGGAALGSAVVDWTDDFEVRIEMRGDNVQVWYRAWNASPDRTWALLGQSLALTSTGAGGASNYVRWGPAHVGSNSAAMTWYLWSYSDDDETGRRDLPFVNPGDLWARDYAGVDGVSYVDAGLHLSAVAGPSGEGEAFTAAPRHPEPLADVFWPAAVSPRRLWRSTAGASAAAAVSLALSLAPTTNETPLPPLVGLLLNGCRGLRTGGVQYKTGGGYTPLATWDLSWSFSFTRQGQAVTPTGAGTAGEYFDLDECRGWWLRLDDGGGTVVWRQVTASDDGVLAGSTTSRKLRLHLDADTVAAADPTSGTAHLCPAAALVLINVVNAPTAEALRIDLDSADTPDNRHQLGSLWAGEVIVPGRAVSDGARISTLARTVRYETPDGHVDSRNQGAEFREFEAGWMELLPTQNALGAAAEPGVVYATQTAGRRPVGAPHATPGTLEGVFRRCRGSQRPVGWIWEFAQSTGAGTDVVVLRHRRDFIAAQITGKLTRRHVIDNTWRVESVSMTELTE